MFNTRVLGVVHTWRWKSVDLAKYLSSNITKQEKKKYCLEKGDYIKELELDILSGDSHDYNCI